MPAGTPALPVKTRSIMPRTAVRTSEARGLALETRVPASETAAGVSGTWRSDAETPVLGIETAVTASGTQVRVAGTAAPASETRGRTMRTRTEERRVGQGRDARERR